MDTIKKRIYTIHFKQSSGFKVSSVDIEADQYELLIIMLPGHHFYLEKQKVAYFQIEDVAYVTSKEITDVN